MVVTAIFVVIGLIAITFFAFVLRKQASTNVEVAELLARLEPVDMPALLNLTDTDQIGFLRSRLQAREVAYLERKRSRAIIVYVRRIVRNTEILLACADRAAHNEDPQIAAAGSELLTMATRTRVRALSTLAKLYGTLLFPSLNPSLPQAITGYVELQRHSEILRSTAAR